MFPEIRTIHKRSSQGGFTLIEVIVAACLLTILGIAVAMGGISALKTQKFTSVSIAAKNLAVSKAEQLAGVQIDNLTSALNSVESNLTVPGHTITFTRTTVITQNNNGSRTINVIVSSTSTYLPQPIQYTTTLAPWEA